MLKTYFLILLFTLSAFGATLAETKFKLINGTDKSLGDYKGQVILVVNVASKCGLTPQYDGLEKIYQKYKDQGFVIIGFPANDFAGQEPGTNEEIVEFCKKNYGVTFPLAQKIVVKGKDQHPLYRQLTTEFPKARKKGDRSLVQKVTAKVIFSEGEKDISWNFEKFLLGRDGKIVDRFSPDTAPEDGPLVTAIEAELKKK